MNNFLWCPNCDRMVEVETKLTTTLTHRYVTMKCPKCMEILLSSTTLIGKIKVESLTCGQSERKGTEEKARGNQGGSK